jgi:hypothetical protein
MRVREDAEEAEGRWTKGETCLEGMGANERYGIGGGIRCHPLSAMRRSG